jgi:hypothetical protein
MVSGTNSCVPSFFGIQGVELFQGGRVLVSVAGPSFLSLLQLSAVHWRRDRHEATDRATRGSLIISVSGPLSPYSPRRS